MARGFSAILLLYFVYYLHSTIYILHSASLQWHMYVCFKGCYTVWYFRIRHQMPYGIFVLYDTNSLLIIYTSDMTQTVRGNFCCTALSVSDDAIRRNLIFVVRQKGCRTTPNFAVRHQIRVSCKQTFSQPKIIQFESTFERFLGHGDPPLHRVHLTRGPEVGVLRVHSLHDQLELVFDSRLILAK
jgi:hypothetical protein